MVLFYLDMKKLILPGVILVIIAGGIFYFISKSTSMKSQPNSQPNSKATTTQITLAEVAKHTNSSDCWTVIDGGVYNITDYIPNHPGGGMITASCGIDATSIFNAQGHSGSVMNTLAQYQIGVLAK